MAHDLDKYLQLARELGADEAVHLAVDHIPVDEKVVADCAGGNCEGYGLSANCPPHAQPPAETRALLAQYKDALLVGKRFPLEVMQKGWDSREWRGAFHSIYKLVAKLEDAVRADGHTRAIAFAAGSCRAAFCAGFDTCTVLEGEPCRFPKLARPSMEGVGIDVYAAMEKAGIDFTRVGEWSEDEEEMVTLVGLVIVL